MSRELPKASQYTVRPVWEEREGEGRTEDTQPRSKTNEIRREIWGSDERLRTGLATVQGLPRKSRSFVIMEGATVMGKNMESEVAMDLRSGGCLEIPIWWN